MPWHRLADSGTPMSVDGRAYRGMNAVWLAMVAQAHGWEAGTWGTYKAWKRRGAQVRRGEKGNPVVLWKATASGTERADDTSPDAGDSDGQVPGRKGRRLLARVYHVFALEQVDGADHLARSDDAQRDTPERIEAADACLTGTGVTVVESGNRACYSRATDTIRLPGIAQFHEPALFYGTWAHEVVHATGHADRLDRAFGQRFGDDAYAVEELVAELGAAMWCAQAGLSAATRPDHAAYLSGWLSVLRQDPRALVTVASRAQATVDWVATHTTHPLPDTLPAHERV
jgi:antirestriction protein ArdC